MILTFSVPEKLKKSFYEMLIIPQTLNINTFRTISAKFINLHTIRKLIENSLKNVPVKAMFIPKAIFTHTVLGILKVGRYYHSPSGVLGAKGLIFFTFIDKILETKSSLHVK